ncbi:MAG: hypothetical protein AAB353_04070, partial [Candidatus Hydrogenedentota bacterium]
CAQENYGKRFGEQPSVPNAVERAMRTIGTLRGVSNLLSPSQEEIDEAKLLLNVYDIFLDSIEPDERIRFRPRIKGSGILDEMEADFCTSNTLYEVKTVHRNLESTDLRQVICYLVAALASRQYAWTDYCIFNPRLAVVYRGQVEEFLTYISGRTPHECVVDVLDALMEREQPLETRF